MKPRNVQQREKTVQEKREKGEERKHKVKFGVLPMPKIQNGMFARTKGSVMLSMRSGPILAAFIPRP